jgi:hypothetical protein
MHRARHQQQPSQVRRVLLAVAALVAFGVLYYNFRLAMASRKETAASVPGLWSSGWTGSVL